MTKIAYNECFGGFSLSFSAMQHYLGLKGQKCYTFNSGFRYATDPQGNNIIYARDIARTDKDLIATIEALGPKANGLYANLQIRDLPEGTKYVIDDYDGFEEVRTIDDFEWQIA